MDESSIKVAPRRKAFGSDVLIRPDATDSIALVDVTLSSLVAADFKVA